MLTRLTTALSRRKHPIPFANEELEPQKWLYLLAHDDDPEEGYSLSADIDPPLEDPDARDLHAVTRFMANANYVPDLILSSRTRRAGDMVALIHAKLKENPLNWSERAVHHGSAAEIIDNIRGIADSARSVMVVSGAKRLSRLALKISRGYGPYWARAARHRMLSEFPKGAFAALSLTISQWSDLAPKAGLVHAFVKPADLAPRDH